MKILLSNSSLKTALLVTADITILGSFFAEPKIQRFPLQNLPIAGQEVVRKNLDEKENNFVLHCKSSMAWTMVEGIKPELVLKC